MEFNILVKKELLPILQNKGFQVVEELNNVVRFSSSNMEVGLAYNSYENSNFIEIGKLGENLYPLSDNVVKNIFNSDLKISKVTPDLFVKNIALLFSQKEGTEILKGNIKSLVNFIEHECSNYTFELIKLQTLETASKAWEKNDYTEFIKIIDEIGIEKSPKSFQLKYKIAKHEE
jgi:hypothetical protein